MRIENAAAVVSGGASGLGLATGEMLATAGAKVALLDIDAARVAEAAARIGAIGLQCDVRDAEAAEHALAKARQAQGPAAILVNCAGIFVAKPIVGQDGPMQLSEFELVIRVNLIGTFNLMRLVAAEMTALEPTADGERGVIVNTASVAAFDGQIGQAAYAASKGGIVALTLPAAREFARDGIRVVTIAPGPFETPGVARLPGGGAAVARRCGAVPQAPGPARGVRHAGTPDSRQPDAQRRGHPPGRRHPPGAAVGRHRCRNDARLQRQCRSRQLVEERLGVQNRQCRSP